MGNVGEDKNDGGSVNAVTWSQSNTTRTVRHEDEDEDEDEAAPSPATSRHRP